jgi:hypothetical protein
MAHKNKIHTFTGILSITSWYVGLSFLCLSSIIFGAIYIYGINEVAVSTLGIEEGEKRTTRMREEIRALEIERAHLTVGSWLEEEAEKFNLFAAGPVHFLSKDSAVVRADQ